LPNYLPELDGLRGLAILAVVLYHCNPRFEGTWMHYPSLWGWAGVIVFFVLSGFLITSTLLTTRGKPRYFHNFHARRALRIWPVYLLLLVVVYLNAPWFIGPPVWEAIKTAPWLAYIFCVQNLIHITMPPAIGPTWALAIEEQYYFFWAPLVRFLRQPWMLATVLAGALAGSPLLRHANLHWMTPTNTLAVGFAGAALALIASSGARSPLNAALRKGPLAFYGRISYGLYMTHIPVFVYFGWFDARMNAYGIPGNLAVVAFRLIATTLVATALWYGLESRVLKLKRYF
jgi:peptidoglycan/LPS O-acetylase OafA/YrhL